MNYQIISADTHMDLTWMPRDIFVENAPTRLRDKMPKVEKTEKGLHWMVEGKEVVGVGGGGLSPGEYTEGEAHHLDRMAEVGFFDGVKDGVYHPSDPDLRIKDQDVDGVDAEVIYGILEIGAGGWLSPIVEDTEVLTASYNIYNQWIADFVRIAPQRMTGLACLTHHDPQIATAQLRRAAELGLRGAEIIAPQMLKPIYHRDWDVLWQASAECGIPISFHTLGISFRHLSGEEEKDYHYINFGLGHILFQLGGPEFLVSTLLSGACERYPEFKFVLGECGIGWIPYVIERTDVEYQDRLFHLGLKLKPSEYWRRQGYSTFQEEYVSMDEIERIGVDSIMWGSDYPHPDGVFPDSKKVIQKGLGHLPESVRQKIICDNAATLYRFN
ncbi:MAG: amidohydrolase family protein [Dehalococcoidia bacterium]